jgi:hypothetical protein
VLRQSFARWTAIHALLVIAGLELGLNRVAVPMLRPTSGVPPAWHTALDYAGLFLFYFAGALAAAALVASSAAAIVARRGWRDAVAHGLVIVAAALTVVPLVVTASPGLVIALELALAAALLALGVTVYGRGRDLGIAVGFPVLIAPLLLHVAAVLGAGLLWPEPGYERVGAGIARTALLGLCVAAMITPYCFAPRPFARAVTRPGPVIAAIAVAGAGAVVLAVGGYGFASRLAARALGVELAEARTDPRLALYLLAIVTLAWTIASCALATTRARRTVGLGLSFIVLGGYAFQWPHHYSLPLLGAALIAEAARTVREEELAALPLEADTPSIADPIWASYIGAVAHGLRSFLTEVHTLTTRDEGGLTSSVIVGECRGLPARVRIERVAGSVLALDVAIGREIDEAREATVTVWAIQPRGLGASPAAPPAAPAIRTGDAAFDERFKVRGSQRAAEVLLDAALRERAVALLDGWLALWGSEGLRYRVYPGRSAPLDHPIPLSDLALGQIPPTAHRLVGVIELLMAMAERALPPAPRGEPAALGAEGAA